jgi:hypothetical protein
LVKNSDEISGLASGPSSVRCRVAQSGQVVHPDGTSGHGRTSRAKKKLRRRDREEKPGDGFPTGTLWGELGRPELREEIVRAGIIWGVDVRTRRGSLFFGMATLERCVRTGIAKETHLLTLPIDFGTDDPECLIAACLVLKGSHCYGRKAGEADAIEPGLN